MRSNRNDVPLVGAAVNVSASTGLQQACRGSFGAERHVQDITLQWQATGHMTPL
jgi:hypothetical protein